MLAEKVISVCERLLSYYFYFIRLFTHTTLVITQIVLTFILLQRNVKILLSKNKLFESSSNDFVKLVLAVGSINVI